MDGSMDEGDTEFLISLGANIVNQDEFESELVGRLEKHLEEQEKLARQNSQQQQETPENVDNSSTSDQNNLSTSSTSNEKGPITLQGGQRSSSTDGHFHMQKETTVVKIEAEDMPPPHVGLGEQAKPFRSQGQGSILAQALLAGKARNLLEDSEEEAAQPLETEQEKRIRCGEVTPFGTEVEVSSPKKDSFMEFHKYLKDQQNLEQKKRKSEPRKKGRKNRDGSPKKHHKNKESTLNMSVLFPKKRKRKEAMGTEISDDFRDQRKKPGKTAAEKSSMYLNYSDDSEYIPSESEKEDSDPEFTLDEPKASTSKTARKSRKARKGRKPAIREKSSGEESSDYESDVERPTKRLRKEADDGDGNYYHKRVQQWKENETRFSGKFQTFEGGFKLPIHLWESLYTYQKVGVKWMWELHLQRCGGILGDEMGLGKTIQVINFLTGLSCSNMTFRYSEYKGLGPVLLITPATVMHQWVKEFHTWWPPFRVAILHESGSFAGTKAGLIKSMQTGNGGVLITSYSGLVNNQNEILQYNWHYMILDEGHKIRNPDAQITLVAKQVKTPHRLILSGSPLQNNLKELWSLFDFVYPGKLGTLPTFLEQFAVPITHGGYSNATEVQVAVAYKCAKALRAMINPYLLRRMKSDVKDHINLPEKTEQVLFVKMAEDQRSLYKSYVASKEIDSIIQGRFNLFVGLINLRKICNHPHLFDGGPKIIKANPNFCKQIPKVKSGLNGTADPIEEDEEGEDIELDPSESFGHWSKSGKMVVVETLLKLWKSQGHKVLLFTQSRQMLCILENFIRQCNYKYLRLDGSTSISSRQPLINKFNTDDEIFIFLLTTRVGGLGVNLTAANRVILYDPDWNPSTDIQARERAWRIGQLRQVTIYRLILSGTIEEKMYHRQIFKQFLTNRVLKDPKQKRFFKSNDLLELFTFNEGSKGTESEAIFAGTGSSVKPKRSSKSKKKEPRERPSGKFRDVPNLVKQKVAKNTAETEEAEAMKPANQDEYVLKKLFSKSGPGVEAALRHDKIVDTDEADYMLVEKEAEVVAKKAISTLKRSREECWNAESGHANWTGNQGQIKQPIRFGKKKAPATVTKAKEDSSSKASSSKNSSGGDKYFSGAALEKESEGTKNGQKGIVLGSSDILAIIRARKGAIPISIEASGRSSLNNNNGEGGTDFGPDVKAEQLELLGDIREFIAFQAMVDGQATTDELIQKFGERLPNGQSPLFKQMLNQLCTFRKVEGRGVWRLKNEFR